jgi:hypothetical protein
LLKIIKLSEAFLAKSTLIKTFTLSSFMEWMVRKLFDFIDIISHWGEAPMAHACNPNYSGDRDQEDLCSKPDSQTLHDTLCRKKFTKMGWWSGTRCRHWVQTVVLQKKPTSPLLSTSWQPKFFLVHLKLHIYKRLPVTCFH